MNQRHVRRIQIENSMNAEKSETDLILIAIPGPNNARIWIWIWIGSRNTENTRLGNCIYKNQVKK